MCFDGAKKKHNTTVESMTRKPNTSFTSKSPTLHLVTSCCTVHYTDRNRGRELITWHTLNAHTDTYVIHASTIDLSRSVSVKHGFNKRLEHLRTCARKTGKKTITLVCAHARDCCLSSHNVICGGGDAVRSIASCLDRVSLKCRFTARVLVYVGFCNFHNWP